MCNNGGHFDLSKRLRFKKTTYLFEDKVVKTETHLETRDNTETAWWYRIPSVDDLETITDEDGLKSIGIKLPKTEEPVAEKKVAK
jgi:hypothetical protein